MNTGCHAGQHVRKELHWLYCGYTPITEHLLYTNISIYGGVSVSDLRVCCNCRLNLIHLRTDSRLIVVFCRHQHQRCLEGAGLLHVLNETVSKITTACSHRDFGHAVVSKHCFPVFL